MSRMLITLLSVALLFSLLSTPSCFADSKSWQPIGPFGGTVLSLYLNPADSQTLYGVMADSWEQNPSVYKTTNGGATWSADSAMGTSMSCLIIDPADGKRRYRATSNLITMTTDGGATWTNLTETVPWDSYPSFIAIDPAGSGNIFAGIYGEGIYKYTDADGKWTALNSGLTDRDVITLMFSPADSRTFYVLTYSSGVFKTVDGGSSWSEASNGLDANDRYLQAFTNSADLQTMYAWAQSGFLYRTTNGGGQWSLVDDSHIGMMVTAFVADPFNGRTLYASLYHTRLAGVRTNLGIYKSTDGGVSWTPANNGLTDFNVNDLAVDPANRDTIYAATHNMGVFKSTNGGGSWVAVNNGYSRLSAPKVVVDPNNARTLYVGVNGAGIFKSSDGGTSWSSRSSGLTSLAISSLTISKGSNPVLYAGTSYINGTFGTNAGVFRSADGGASWTHASGGIDDWEGMPGWYPAFFNSVVIDPSNPQTVYAATNESTFKTTDGGASWLPINNGLVYDSSNPYAIYNVEKLVIDPVNTQTLYGAAYNPNDQTGRIVKTTNGGASWQALITGVSTGTFLTIMPSDPKILYVGSSSGDAILKSVDGGQTWSATTFSTISHAITALVPDPVNSQIIYAGTNGNGVFMSADGGASWTGTGNANMWRVSSLVIDPQDSQSVYAGIDGTTVFKSTRGISPPVITGDTAPTFVAGTPGSYRVPSNGWPTPVHSLSGALPAGIDFDAATGILSGTPASNSAGAYPLFVTAANGVPPDGARGIVLTVQPANALTVAIASPTSSATVSAPATITGSASGSGLTGVELQITDGLKFLQQNGTFGAPPVWLAATGAASWSLATGSASWTAGTVYTITARGVNGAGAASQPTASTFIVAPGTKTVTRMSLSDPATIRAGDSAGISGSIVNSSKTGISGLSIVVLVTPPPTPADPNPAPIATAAVSDAGSFSLASSVFKTPGIYQIQARFEGTSQYAASTAAAVLPVTPQSGCAVIVTGKATDNSLLDMHTASTDAIYSTLVDKRGFLTDNVNYLASTASAAVTKQQIHDAITIWARDKLAAAPAPFYLFMIDHGTADGFVVGEQTVTPEELKDWLNALESDPAVAASGALESYKRFVVIGTCYSGQFAPKLSKQGRVIITSAGADEQSLAGFSIYNSSTSTTYSGGEYLVDNLLNFLGRGDSFKDAVMQSSSNVALRDPRKVGLGPHSGAYDTLAQHPLLDDTGDGAASYLPSSTTNGAASAALSLGVGIRTLGNPADIAKVTDTTIIPPTQTGDVPLWLRVNDNSRIAKAWMEIRTPVTSVSSNGGSGQVIPHLLTMPLYYDGLQWNSSYAFPNAGTYNVLYYTQDNQTGDISPAAHSVVYKQLASNTAPSAVSLISPADEGSVSPTFALSWQEATSNNGVTYTLLVAKDQTFNGIVYKQEGIAQAAAYLTDGQLKDPATSAYYCQNGDSYCYWKIQAIDKYGAVTESDFRSFTIVSTNGLPGVILGYLRDSVSGAPIAKAAIKAGSTSATSYSNGAFLMVLPTGRVNVAVTSAAGYQLKSVPSVVVSAGKATDASMALTPNVAGPKLGDCNRDNVVSITEVQNAVGMFLGLNPVLSCVDKDGVGGVSIGEMQQVVNSF